jgi:flagellar hook-length control protein FliK
MADTALSVTASPLAALLANAPADSHSGSATAQPSDPFAALLASATASPAETKSATAAADAVAALLASATKVAPSPVIVAPVAAATLPTPVEALPAEAEGALPVADHADTDDKDEKDAETQDPSDDPLADAIASGATAVLALAPMIVAPVQPQPSAATPAPAPIKIDAPIGMPKRVPLAGVPVGRPFTPVTQFAAGTNARLLDATQTSAASAAATTANNAKAAQTNADMASAQAEANVAKLDVAQAKADSSSTQADSRTPRAAAADAQPATTAPSPEMVSAAIAALKQGNGATAEADRATGVEQAPVAPTPIAQAQVRKPQSPAVQQVQNQTTQAPAPVHRRGDEIAAPRRAGDTRKRVETTVGDTAAAGLGQRAEPAVTFGRAAIVQPKGDAVVEQSLTIARDGAWLDTLARDIASSAGNGSDLRFKLEPQNLGSLTVAISQGDDGASIRMTADKETTRNLLLDAQPKLIAEARAQGLKVSDTHVDLKQDQSQNQNQHQNAAQDAARWAQGSAGQGGTAQNGQNRQSSPDHQPFVSNLGRKAEAESESLDGDSDALYA